MNQAAAAPPVALAVPRRSGRQRVWRALDQASIYLPVLLMGLLALGSYWLVRITPMPPVDPTQAEVGAEPDHTMRGFSIQVFNSDGSLRAEISGDEARHYPDTGRLEIDVARVRAYNEARQLTEASARRVLSNADKTEFVLQGDAVVVRHALLDPAGRVMVQPMEFRGDYLQVDTEAETVFSDQPVTMVRGADRLSGNRLLYQGEHRTVELTGRVRVQMQPRSP
ncbi:LPS export ABC transporter periplasmic protein LptC [Hydrogenophaga sp.]|uniref:LPS export ABC transporter periplasmic protein LptC n=1 Tax=Hydrogenophaga sp. TaxID=1904254 RepID=UPI002CE7A465|nr:LPS export ABC transporter periplasmic protein LptC [Hydrogenophaga sp.]HMP10335.1 LPS export ABC transporter periplasmic protein LptC [Hydrogenophaga sp.]